MSNGIFQSFPARHFPSRSGRRPLCKKSAIRNHQSEIGRRTRGDERVNRNNHPIRAGDVIGTHNGTIYNADYLFRRFKLRRFAEVDDIISDFGLEIAN